MRRAHLGGVLPKGRTASCLNSQRREAVTEHKKTQRLCPFQPAAVWDKPRSARANRVEQHALKMRSLSPPLVFGVFPLQLGFDPRVMLAPETGQILRHLHWPHARGQNVR
jgi:hypothetical protein